MFGFFGCCDCLLLLSCFLLCVRTLRAAGFASEASGVKKFEREGWRHQRTKGPVLKEAREESNQISLKGVLLLEYIGLARESGETFHQEGIHLYLSVPRYLKSRDNRNPRKEARIHQIESQGEGRI